LSAATEDLSKSWSIAELAALVRLSPSRFGHLFVEEMGVSPTRYLMECRLAESCRLLSSTFLSVKEIAGSVGFSDRSYFNRAFKSRFGCSPGAIRGKQQRPASHGRSMPEEEQSQPGSR
jgi:AraC-like DNA-binding protein